MSVDIRTENVGAQQSGATVSIMEDGIMSPELHGTSDWQRETLYLKVGGQGADVDVALRVGGFGSLNTGKAFFRNASLVKIAAPPPNATPTYDLQAIRQQGGAGADRLADLAGVDVRGAVWDRMGGLAHLRRRRFSHLQPASHRDGGAPE